MDAKLTVGDHVWLKTGSAKMNLTRDLGNEDWECVWQTNGVPYKEVYKSSLLTKNEPKNKRGVKIYRG